MKHRTMRWPSPSQRLGCLAGASVLDVSVEARGYIRLNILVWLQDAAVISGYMAGDLAGASALDVSVYLAVISA